MGEKCFKAWHSFSQRTAELSKKIDRNFYKKSALLDRTWAFYNIFGNSTCELPKNEDGKETYLQIVSGGEDIKNSQVMLIGIQQEGLPQINLIYFYYHIYYILLQNSDKIKVFRQAISP